jgi:hypothetical protein
MPTLLWASRSRFSTLTFIGSAIGSDTSIEIPSFAAGDVCVIWNYVGNAMGQPTPPSVTPSGFTLLDYQGSGSVGAAMSAKILTGSETSVTGMDRSNLSGDVSWIAAIFQPSAPLASLTANLFAGNGTSGDPSISDIAAAGATPPILVLGQMSALGAISPRTTSPTMNEIQGAGTYHFGHYLIYNAANVPANQSYDMDDEGLRNILQAGYLSFTPA